MAPLTLLLSLSYYARISNTKALGSLVNYSIREYNAGSPYYLFSSLPKGISGFKTAIDKQDARPVLVRNYLEKYNSPLAKYADYIVQISDEKGIDFRWVVAISMAESGGCHHIPYQSNNCWGYGIYGDQVVEFDSLQEGITKVAELIAGYHAKGAHTPEEVMRWYAPPSVAKGGPWAKTINYVFTQME